LYRTRQENRAAVGSGIGYARKLIRIIPNKDAKPCLTKTFGKAPGPTKQVYRSWQIGLFLPTHEVPPKSTDNDYPLCLAALSI